MVSDKELVNRLRDILRSSDLDTTTAGTVRRKLEQEFEVDLYGRRAFITEQIDLFLDTHVATEAQPLKDDVEGNEEEEENENEAEAVAENGDGGSHLEEEAEEEEEESDDDKRSKKKRSAKVEKDTSRKGRGFSKPMALSPLLQEFIGEPELARTEVVKRIWAYIREKDLQNPKNRRKILCDETLRGLFKVNSIDMFQMNKVLSKHIWPIEEEEEEEEAAPVKSSQKEKKRKYVGEGKNKSLQMSEDEPKQKEKRSKGGASGFSIPLPISDALVKFLGTGEIEMSRGDVIKRMWKYIKENELQDPSDKRRILCDDKLKELFEVDSFTGFTVSKLLTVHFIKTQE